jgi:hypothetical protein
LLTVLRPDRLSGKIDAVKRCFAPNKVIKLPIIGKIYFFPQIGTFTAANEWELDEYAKRLVEIFT